jgi:hypothetical protein
MAHISSSHLDREATSRWSAALLAAVVAALAAVAFLILVRLGYFMD